MNRVPSAPNGFGVVLPAWLQEELQTVPAVIADPVERMRLLNRLAERNVREATGGPFSAMVIDETTAEVVALGVNLVLHGGLSILHAEVVTLSLAQARVGRFSLAGDDAGPRTLVVNAQPCAMCLGAICWSGVTRLESSVPGAVVEQLTGFDEGPVPHDWIEQLERRGISVETGLIEHEARQPMELFGSMVAAGSTTLYNGRSV